MLPLGSSLFLSATDFGMPTYRSYKRLPDQIKKYIQVVQTLACPFTGHCKHLPHKEAYMCMQLAATESNSETHRLNKAKIEWHYHSIDL
jgi:hypothetical protein